MSPKPPIPVRRGAKPARTAAAPAATPAARGAAGPGEFRHPRLDEARALARQGKPTEAADLLEALSRDVPPLERAQLLVIAAQYLKAVDRKRALALSQEATRLQPALGRAWMSLALCLDERRERKQAVEAAQRALSLPLPPRERVDLGRFLSKLGVDADALAAVKRGYAESREELPLATYVLRVARQCADWATSEAVQARLATVHTQGQTEVAAETPRTHLLWCADEVINHTVIQAFARKAFPAHPPLVTAAWPGEITPERPLRVAYLSSDYRDHATSLLALGMMRHHDRERFRFYAYCTSYDDGSALRRDMLNRFDVARTFAQLTDERAARQIMADRIDVLVDLNGLTEGSRMGILAWRPAPVQVTYLGFPGSAGGRYVDYVIGDPVTVPDDVRELYAEKVIRIPPTYQINDYQARWLPPRGKRPREIRDLPAGRPVLGMFNNVNKVGPQVWDTWMRILHGRPDAVLWVIDPGEVARGYLVQATSAAGIDPARVIFAPKARQEAHIARLQWCDLILDPWPYGGHTTTGDALFAGVPQVVLRGTNFASRVSGGLLEAAGLGELVCPDTDAYVRTALALLADPARLAALRRQLRQKRLLLPAFDAATRTRQLEAAYMEIHQRHARGKPPRHIDVRVDTPPAAHG